MLAQIHEDMVTDENYIEFRCNQEEHYKNKIEGQKAFEILISKIDSYISKTTYMIKKSDTLMKNGYDVEIEDDYTIGYILQHVLACSY